MCGRNLGNFLMPALASMLIDGDVIQKQAREPKVSRATQAVICSACHASVSPSFTWCPHCGQALKPHPCVYCGQILEINDRNCLHCGAPSVPK